MLPLSLQEYVDTQNQRRKPRNDRGKSRGSRKKGDNVLHVEKLLADDLTRSYKSIADEMGLTKERVRQIASKVGDTGRLRAVIRAEEKFAHRTRAPGFAHLAKRWLAEVGYRYCGCSSHEGGRVGEFKIYNGRCQRCNAQCARRHSATPEGAEKAKIWRQSEAGKETQRRAHKKWAEKHPERVKEVARRAYGKMESDPVEYGQHLAKMRQRYRAQKANGQPKQ